MSLSLQTTLTTVEHERMERQLVKVLASLDMGAGRAKGAFRIFLEGDNLKPRLCSRDGAMLSKGKPVKWSVSEYQAPNIIAFCQPTKPGQIYHEPIFGHDVKDAIEEGKVAPEAIFNGLKLILLGQTDRSRAWKIRKRMDVLRADKKIPPKDKRWSLCSQKSGKHIDTDLLEVLILFSDSMKLAFHRMLTCIQEQHPDAPWSTDKRSGSIIPDLTSLRQGLYAGNDDPFFEVALPLPANTSPENWELILQAAKWAGIPNPYPVEESAAALAYYYQSTFEDHGSFSDSLCTLAMDIGTGTVDVSVQASCQTDPFRVIELVSSKTEWCGGASINRACWRLVRAAIEEDMFKEKCGMSIEDFDLERKVNIEFETAKRNFKGESRVTLHIPDLPNQPQWRMGGGNKIVLQVEDMMAIFQDSIQRIRMMLRNTIAEVEREDREQGKPVRHINRVVLYGGGGSNPYLFRKLNDILNNKHQPLAGYPILVSRPQDRITSTSETVACGSLLILTDRHFIKESVLRMGYCIAVDKMRKDVERSMENRERVRVDPDDKKGRLRQLAHFLVRAGQRVSFPFSTYYHGTATINIAKKKKGVYELKEVLFRTATEYEDDAWVKKRGADFHEMPSPLEFKIREEETASWCRNMSHDGKPYFEVDFQWGIHLKNNIQIVYELKIPTSGRFPETGSGDRCGVSSICHLGRYNIAGDFELLDSRHNKPLRLGYQPPYPDLDFDDLISDENDPL